MPYTVEERSCTNADGEEGSHVVVKEDDGTVMGCHASRAAALAQIAALEAAEANKREGDDMDDQQTPDAVPAQPLAAAKTLDGWEAKFGGGVKMRKDGGVEGDLIVFSTADDPDLEKDFFDADTDYGQHTETDLYYHHGLDPKIGRIKIGRARLMVHSKGVRVESIGPLEIEEDEVELWEEKQRSKRARYLESIKTLVQDGELGWSSGTAGHLVVREKITTPGLRRTAYRIKKWPLGLDASLTPTPAEPRTAAVPVKSLDVPDLFDEDGALKTRSDRKTPQSVDEFMSLVFDAFRREFDPGFERAAWVEVLASKEFGGEDYIIAYLDDGFFKIGYAVAADDTVTFADTPIPVQRHIEWREQRSLRALYQQHTGKRGGPSVPAPQGKDTFHVADTAEAGKHTFHFHFAPGTSSSTTADLVAQVVGAGAGTGSTPGAQGTATPPAADEAGADVSEPNGAGGEVASLTDNDDAAETGGANLEGGNMDEDQKTQEGQPLQVVAVSEVKALVDQAVDAAFTSRGMSRKTVKAPHPTSDDDLDDDATGADAYKANLNLKHGLGDDETKAVAAYIRAEDAGALGNAAMKMKEIAIKASNDTDMNITTSADGGNAVPTGHANRIIAKVNEKGFHDQVGVTVVPGRGTTVNVPVEDEAVTDGEFVSTSEGSDDDRDAPALGQKTMTLVRYTKQIQLTPELLEDEDSNLLDYVENWISRKIAFTRNKLLITAVTTNGTQLKRSSSGTTIAAADVKGTYYAIEAEWSEAYGDFAWVMRRATEGVIRGLQGNDFIFDVTPAGNKVNRMIEGAMVHNSASVDAIGIRNKSVLFGAFGVVGVRNGAGLAFMNDPYKNYPHRTLRYTFRTVYTVLQAAGVGYMEHPTT